jgi:hypothetical protein
MAPIEIRRVRRRRRVDAARRHANPHHCGEHRGHQRYCERLPTGRVRMRLLNSPLHVVGDPEQKAAHDL